EPRNPAGTGVARKSATLIHQPAPRIEDPRELISSEKTRPAPAGVGALGRHWEPRRKYVGTTDKLWLEERMPLLPHDFDERSNERLFELNWRTAIPLPMPVKKLRYVQVNEKEIL